MSNQDFIELALGSLSMWAVISVYIIVMQYNDLKKMRRASARRKDGL